MTDQRRPATGQCPSCGKLCYLSKRDAKRAIRGHKGRQGRLNAYRCGRYWHIGHLPGAVVAGDQSRADIVSHRSGRTRGAA